MMNDFVILVALPIILCSIIFIKVCVAMLVIRCVIKPHILYNVYFGQKLHFSSMNKQEAQDVFDLLSVSNPQETITLQSLEM
jgi:hypothetical protein